MAGLSFLHHGRPVIRATGLISFLFLAFPATAQVTPDTKGNSVAQTAAAASALSPAGSEAVQIASDAERFAAFKRDFRATALADGITPAVYDRAMATAELRPKVVKSNTHQPEFVKPIWEYLDNALSPRRKAEGRKMLHTHALLLRRIEAKYGVPKQIVVAVWGMESFYGRIMGNHPMFSALSTLAYDGPRSAFARAQLLAALHMMQDQSLSPAEMKASWAGAFGQTQFIPTTYLSYGVDGDGDGRIDLWNSVPDALASTANLLKHKGWLRDRHWGKEVRMPKLFPWQEADPSLLQPIEHWRKLGVKASYGVLPRGAEQTALLLPAGADGPAFLLRHNYHVILQYNHATAYALGVALLSDYLAGRPGVHKAWPRQLKPLSRDDVMAMQSALNALGLHAGKPDGLIGPATRAAIRSWQSTHGLRADGFATQGLLSKIRDAAGPAQP